MTQSDREQAVEIDKLLIDLQKWLHERGYHHFRSNPTSKGGSVRLVISELPGNRKEKSLPENARPIDKSQNI